MYLYMHAYTDPYVDREMVHALVHVFASAATQPEAGGRDGIYFICVWCMVTG